MGVLHLYLHQGIALDPLDLQQTQLQSMHPYFFGIIPWFLKWFTNPLGVMFHNKSSVCSFTPCAIFQPLIIFCHSITKTQTLSKVPLCIFHDANHYKNNQNDHKQVNWSHSNHLNFIKSWFFLSLTWSFSHVIAYTMSGFDLAIHNSQFVKRFGSLQMSFCIFTENCKLLKSDVSWMFRVTHWTSYIVGYFKPIKYPPLNNNVISQRFIVHISPN